MILIPTPSIPLEDLKNQFLAAIYRNENLDCLFKKALLSAPITETDEKHLRQILTACKRFNRTGSKDHERLQKSLRDRARRTNPVYTGITEWEDGLGLADWQKDALFRHAITFQLTTGCSNYCRRCNEWALPRVRGHFTHDAVSTLLGELLARGNDDLALYGGSDPLDWHHAGYSLDYIINQLPGPVNFSILTKIPKGTLELAANLVKNNIPLSVSLTSRNVVRIRALEAAVAHKISKQHATSDLLIPAGQDEDFYTVKPSITDSYGTEIALDGAFIIIPAFTSALYPFGHKKIPITRDTSFFPIKKLGRPALLVDYFKPLEVEGKTGIFQLSGLLDVQIENILLDNGAYELTPPGMRSIKEYFEIFDDKARLQRKKMTVSVIRRLKKECLKTGPLAALPHTEKQAYLDKITSHLDFTRKNKVTSARVSAAAYLLAAVREYLSVPTPKTDIIAHLTREEFERISEQINGPKTSQDLADLFADPVMDAWELFRYHALGLVHKKTSDAVDRFIKTACARYDGIRDRFIPNGV